MINQKNLNKTDKKIILVIDTAQAEQIKVGLVCDNKKSKKEIIVKQKNISTVSAINIMLSKEKIDCYNISGIYAVKGPRAFTALRQGITTANVLAYSKKIPITGVADDVWIKPEKYLKKLKRNYIIKPEYQEPPSITKPKKLKVLGGKRQA
ncbi:MAG: hypothetical protein V1853_00485 [bacterium]